MSTGGAQTGPHKVGKTNAMILLIILWNYNFLKHFFIAKKQGRKHANRVCNVSKNRVKHHFKIYYHYKFYDFRWSACCVLIPEGWGKLKLSPICLQPAKRCVEFCYLCLSFKIFAVNQIKSLFVVLSTSILICIKVLATYEIDLYD